MSLERTAGQPVAAGGTCTLGGELTVNRMGFGAMQITGPGIWGPPADEDGAVAVLRKAVSLGVDLIDTADSYGPTISEELIHRALHPYDNVVIATKAGLTRTGPDKWHALGDPVYLKQQCELSLRRLGVEAIELFQLHRIDARLPLADQLGALVELQQAGKIRHIGLSEVTVSQLQQAQAITSIVSVQNRYNLLDRTSEPVLDYCEGEGIGFIPWFPIATGALADAEGPLRAIADSTGHTPAQLALAWLLARSKAMLPIPGTKSLEHVQENCDAALINLAPQVLDQLSGLSAVDQDRHSAGSR